MLQASPGWQGFPRARLDPASFQLTQPLSPHQCAAAEWEKDLRGPGGELVPAVPAAEVDQHLHVKLPSI